MSHRRYLQIALLVSGVTAASAPQSARAQPVMTFGDDLVADGAPALDAALLRAGFNVSVANLGSVAATAELFAVRQPNALTTAVRDEGGIEVVYLSLGANDIYSLYQQNRGATAAEQIGEYLQVIVSTLRDVHPDVQVLVTGYPFSNFTRTSTCQMLAEDIFGAGWSQALINRAFLAAIDNHLITLSEGDSAITFVPVDDVFQRVRGGTRDISEPSPSTLLRDCVRPNAVGYTILMDEVVARYWSASAVPEVTLVVPTDPVCSGAPIAATTTSTRATRFVWRNADGFLDETGDSLTVVAPNLVGDWPLTVTALNGPWRATSTATVTIASCTDAGVAPDAGRMDAGFEDAATNPDAAPRPIDPTAPELDIEGNCRSVGGAPDLFVAAMMILAGLYGRRRT